MVNICLGLLFGLVVQWMLCTCSQRMQVIGTQALAKTECPAQVDSSEVQQVKTLIGYSEARSAARVVGCHSLHFLDMPFYKTGPNSLLASHNRFLLHQSTSHESLLQPHLHSAALHADRGVILAAKGLYVIRR